MNGVENVDDLQGLSIIGINQFSKEIEELKHVKDKKIDELGLHRNEETMEIEGEIEEMQPQSTEIAGDISINLKKIETLGDLSKMSNIKFGGEISKSPQKGYGGDTSYCIPKSPGSSMKGKSL